MGSNRATDLGRDWTLVFAVLAVFVLAVLVRLGSLDLPGKNDEFYHILAAAGWLQSGEFAIADGIYGRASLYTLMVAGLWDLGNGSIEMVRLSSVLFGGLLVAGIFLWARWIAGPIAGWTAALAAVFWPDGILVSQFVRFYAVHGLLYFIGAVTIYVAATQPLSGRMRGFLAAVAAAAFAVAFLFTPLTAIGIALIGFWAGLAFAVPALLKSRFGYWILALLVLAGAGAMAALWQAGILAKAWEFYRFTPDWAAAEKDNIKFYHRALRDTWQTLWPLTPLAILVAYAHRPRATLFSAVIILGAIVIQSFGGMKAERYIYYAMPFLFTIWGVAAAAIGPEIAAILTRVVKTALGHHFERPRFVGGFALALLAMALGFLAYSNWAVSRSLVLARGDQRPELSVLWPSAARRFAEDIAAATVVASPRDTQSLFYFGRVDIVTSSSRLDEVPGHREFSLDPRTGRPVLGTPETMAELMACTPDGLLFLPVEHRPETQHLLSRAADLAPHTTLSLIEDGGTGLEATRWQTGAIDQAACDRVRSALDRS